MTLTFDCPWCGDSLSADVDAPTVRCGACAVSVDMADPVVAVVATLPSVLMQAHGAVAA